MFPQLRELYVVIGISLMPLLVLRMTSPLDAHLQTREVQFDGSVVLVSEVSQQLQEQEQELQKGDSCAICFFGLPRSFQSLVLPSVITNILIPNMEYGCDIFAHYYDIQYEEKGRASKGGVIDTEAIALLKAKVHEIYKGELNFVSIPDVVVVSDTDETFWAIRGDDVQHIRHAKAEDGNFLFFPWRDKSYEWPTSTDNIVKQWHSIEQVWYTMKKHGKAKQIRYNRVAMFRSDVVYVTPIDIYDTSRQLVDENNTVAVIPKFATYPVNDRMIYGPYDAVRVWATQRFARVEEHSRDRPGFGMHSERYLKDTILPAIEDEGFEVHESPHICFFRARADGNVHLNDCDDNSRFSSVSFRRKQMWVEDASNATCQGQIDTGRRTNYEKIVHRRVNCE